MSDNAFAFHVVKNPGTVTAAYSGLGSAPSLEGAGLTSIDDAFGTYLEHSTPSVQNSPAGLITTFDVLAAGWNPTIEFEVQLSAVLADLRLWIGLFSQRPDLLSPTLGLPGPHIAAFYLDSTVLQWRGVSSNATQVQEKTIPGTVTTGQRFRLRIEIDGGSPPTAVKFYVNELAVLPTNSVLPGLSEPLGIGIRVVNPVSNVAKQVRWNRASWKYTVRLT